MLPDAADSGGQDDQEIGAKGKLYGHIGGQTHAGVYPVLHRGHNESTPDTQESAGKTNDYSRHEQGNDVSDCHTDQALFFLLTAKLAFYYKPSAS
jgi:hypothetical protein